MTEFLEKCTVCGSLVDEEDLFCAECGTEAPDRKHSERHTHGLTHNFQCGGCGASMSYDASARTLRCPFCGSEKLEHQRDATVLAPTAVVPFEVSQDQALHALRLFLRGSFWRPGDLATSAVVTGLTRVFVPYWVFSARTLTYWTADSSQTPPGARSSWYPVSGHHQGQHAGLLIGGSSVLTPNETANLCPFDLAKGQPPAAVDLENVVVEQFRVQRKYARPLAWQGLEALESRACQQFVPGRARNLKVNVRLQGLSSEPVLVPVWMMAYRYRDRVFRFLVNGQTGRITGEAPVSWKKIWLVVGLGVLLLLMILLCLGGAMGWATQGAATPAHTTEAGLATRDDAYEATATYDGAHSAVPIANRPRRPLARAPDSPYPLRYR